MGKCEEVRFLESRSKGEGRDLKGKGKWEVIAETEKIAKCSSRVSNLVPSANTAYAPWLRYRDRQHHQPKLHVPHPYRLSFPFNLLLNTVLLRIYSTNNYPFSLCAMLPGAIDLFVKILMATGRANGATFRSRDANSESSHLICIMDHLHNPPYAVNRPRIYDCCLSAILWGRFLSIPTCTFSVTKIGNVGSSCTRTELVRDSGWRKRACLVPGRRRWLCSCCGSAGTACCEWQSKTNSRWHDSPLCTRVFQ